MLSPKATNLVRLIRAGGCTVTANEQVAELWRLSTAVQDTLVVPMPN
jgi:hypothetical protein